MCGRKKSTVHGIQEDQKKMIEDTNKSDFRSMMVHASRGFRVAWIHLVRVAKATMVGFSLETKPTKY